MTDLTRKEDLLFELEKSLKEDTLVDLIVGLFNLANQYRDEVIRLKKNLEAGPDQ